MKMLTDVDLIETAKAMGLFEEENKEEKETPEE
jgi:hypothetical protein